jgi:multiple sugar transport system ATP-binding protein
MGEIDIDELTKVFGGGDERIVAVDDLDITIEDGEFLVLVGPSGCGKSTTLRCIAGLERTSEGRIHLDGRDVTDAKPADRDMAMVFQNYALYPHMSARGNMAFGLKMTTGLSDDEIDQRVEDAAEMMGIEDLLEKKPGELSGGQQQRVALGRAIVRDPEVFLMDEPLSNLDAKLRSQMRTELQNLHQEFGVTTIYVTHDQTEAMTMGDRIAILDGGELQQIGTPLECYHNPTNRFVAGFIGSPGMNFFETTARRHDGTTLVHSEFEYELESTLDVPDEGGITLGIRPEDVGLADGGERNALTVTVSVTEPLGESTYVYFDVAGERYTATLDGDLIVEPGDELDVVFPEDDVHLFDAESGESIKRREVPTAKASGAAESVGES